MARPPTSHAAILEAAVSVFERHGYAGATIERIAAEAGVSRVTLHRRGVTKAGLLAELAEAATEDYRRRLWPALTGDGTGGERLALALEAVCAAAEANMSLLSALRSHADQHFHEHGEPEAMTRSVFTEPLEKLIREGIEDGTVRAVDAVETATVLFNMVGWTYIHLRSDHRWGRKRALAATLDPVLRGLLLAA